MRIVIAPGAFKGTLSAREAAALLASRHEGDDVTPLPMADGGDDTLEVMLGHGFTERTLPSGASVGERTQSDGTHTVLVELARIAGMRTLASPDPWGASTHAVGVAMREVLATRPHRLLVALGGSASTDGGLGLLQGLVGAPDAGGLAGLRAFIVDNATPVDDVRRDLRSAGDLLAGVELVVLADVDSPLTGPTGAAHRFGPQKGLAPSDCTEADALLAQWARAIGIDPATPGTGAAGGTAALLAALGATIAPGGATVATLIGLPGAVAHADLVLTGEGRLDATTLAGKSPAAVLAIAAAAGVPTRFIVGSADPAVVAQLRDAGVEVVLVDEYRGHG